MQRAAVIDIAGAPLVYKRARSQSAAAAAPAQAMQALRSNRTSPPTRSPSTCPKWRTRASPQLTRDNASDKQIRARPFSSRIQPHHARDHVKASTFVADARSLGLIIARRGVKPALVMKAPSGTFAFF